MKNSNKVFSIFNDNKTLKNVDHWIEWLALKSKLCEEYGSFMPAQIELFNNIYDHIKKSTSLVSVFIAPPASGKTHVISLLGYFLATSGIKTCIVVPNGELLNDFVTHKQKIKFDNFVQPEIITLSEYMGVRTKFEVALVDEAHNLQSAFTLNPNVVKNFSLHRGDYGFEDVLERYLHNNDYVVKTLSIESSTELLKILSQKPYYNKAVKQLQKSLTNWLGFLIATQDECKIKFITANPETRSILPSGNLMLFSATPLEQNDLQFYCNISTNDTHYYPSKIISAKKLNIDYFVLQEKLDFNQKISLSIPLLAHVKAKILILLNNAEGCENWSSILRQKLPKGRIYSITSGLSFEERSKIYHNFLQNKEGILISSSSVFWEGITIKDLKLLLIPDKPFPEPNILDIYYMRKCFQKKIVHRRLIQGMGRIGRIPNQKSIGILLFDYDKFHDVNYITSESFLEKISYYV